MARIRAHASEWFVHPESARNINRLLDENEKLTAEAEAMRTALERIAGLEGGFVYEYRKLAETALKRVDKMETG